MADLEGRVAGHVRLTRGWIDAEARLVEEDWMRGALVYAEPFWAHDCVGLRGDLLAEVREALGV